MGFTIATGPAAFASLLVFVGTLFVLFVGIVLYSRARQVRSVFFWVISIFGAIVLSYLVALFV
ncbi:MAG: hypothetical protein DDT38_01448 [Firmicutes bacterium]|nr:hypothetical protein [candidate division NPL-UPA2 bacterium]